MIKRYGAEIDNTITNAYRANLTTRGTGSNMGASDILEVFSIYAQASTSSYENSRILLKFSMDDITVDRTAGNIPASGAVSFYLNLFNANHGQTVAKNAIYDVLPVSRSWEEGLGLDMEDYSDLTYDSSGSNWIFAASGSAWTSEGGDFLTSSVPTYSVSMPLGNENVDINVTSLVEHWVAGTISNNGIIFKLQDNKESQDGISYYTKKFFARTSEFFYKRPRLEARWNSSIKDQRKQFYYSSSLAPAADNLNTIYLYNYVRGQLKNIPGIGTGAIYVDLYSGSANNSVPAGQPIVQCGPNIAAIGFPATGGYVSTGVYSASICVTASVLASRVTKFFDVWHNGSGTEYYTGSITPKTLDAEDANPNEILFTKITNLKDTYYTRERKARFRLYVRPKNWSPTIYTVASTAIENRPIEDGYYEISRVIDNFKVIPFNTGSDAATKMSMDTDGNFFDLDMRMFEPGYQYKLRFAYYLNSEYVEQPEQFKFRVEE